MKRYSNLFEKLCSIENIALAHEKAKKVKAHYREVKWVDRESKRCFEFIRQQLLSKTFKTAPYIEMIKNEYGKNRIIHKLPYFPDRIVHHAIVQVAGSIWRKTLIRDTYACVRGRGIHDGLRRIKAALKDFEGTRYCLKMDAEKFYASMDHDVLKAIIRRKIKDADFLDIIDEVIDSSPGIVGVPIGNYLSQFFGNLYLSGFDHFMKEVCGCRHYFRYCDDIVILDGDKDKLYQLREQTQSYWQQNLKLNLKANWQVFPVDSRGIDFLGYRFFHGYVLLRKSIAKKFKQKMQRIGSGWRKMQPVSIVSCIMSYDGWLKHADCHNLKVQHVDKKLQGVLNLARLEMKVEGI